MTYKAPELLIPPDDPFKHDALQRKPLVKFVTDILSKANGPFVMALDAPWGSGKTTFVRMLEAQLKSAEFACIYFNAWKVDYLTDPLVALVSAIEQIEPIPSPEGAQLRDQLKRMRRVTGVVAKRGLVAAAKAATIGVLDLDKEFETIASELAAGVTADVVDDFKREKELLERFRLELAGAVEQLPAVGKKPTLIFIVDELDRCRPTFAIELLERIKHLFDVPNVVFLLALDKRQLEAITACVYGERIDAPEYLRRFIDLEYALPMPATDGFTESLITRFGLGEQFAARTHHELRHDRQYFVEIFTTLANLFDLSLRAREGCVTRLSIVLDQTPSNHHLEPVLVSLLIVLRSVEPGLFHQFCSGAASPGDVMSALRNRIGGAKFCDSHAGAIVEAYLIIYDPDADRLEANKRALEKRVDSDGETRERTKLLRELLPNIARFGRSRVPLKHLSAKIDLAASVLD
jgi:hypothetical protein